MIKLEELKEYEQYIIEKRRDFHKHPETGFQEFRTSAIVKEELLKFGFTIEECIGVTGLVGTLIGNKNGKTIGLRADMDALNMQELNDIPYKSIHEGVMHSCGHDTHTAMLLGAAKYMSEHKDKLNGTLKVIFQAAEEGPMPGGGSFVVEGGYIDKCDAVFGTHIITGQYAGTIGIKSGPAMAAPDEFLVKVIGTGTHASEPHTGVDPILISSQIIQAFQNIISRNTDPVDPAVISVCTIQSGTAFNILPESAEFSGTIRTLNPDTRSFIFKRMEEIIKHITLMNGATYEVEFIKAYPPLINNPKMADFAKKVAIELIGEENVEILTKPSMGGEDFAYYLEQKPGAFIWLGGRPIDSKEFYNNHNPKFDIDESSLLIGSALHINLVIEFLK